MDASSAGHEACVRLLLAARADPSAPNCAGTYPRQLATGRPDLLRILEGDTLPAGGAAAGGGAAVASRAGGGGGLSSGAPGACVQSEAGQSGGGAALEAELLFPQPQLSTLYYSGKAFSTLEKAFEAELLGFFLLLHADQPKDFSTALASVTRPATHHTCHTRHTRHTRNTPVTRRLAGPLLGIHAFSTVVA